MTRLTLNMSCYSYDDFAAFTVPTHFIKVSPVVTVLIMSLDGQPTLPHVSFSLMWWGSCFTALTYSVGSPGPALLSLLSPRWALLLSACLFATSMELLALWSWVPLLRVLANPQWPCSVCHDLESPAMQAATLHNSAPSNLWVSEALGTFIHKTLINKTLGAWGGHDLPVCDRQVSEGIISADRNWWKMCHPVAVIHWEKGIRTAWEMSVTQVVCWYCSPSHEGDISVCLPLAWWMNIHKSINTQHSWRTCNIFALNFIQSSDPKCDTIEQWLKGSWGQRELYSLWIFSN